MQSKAAWQKRCQASMEYVIIVGFVVVITIPLILIYYNYTDRTNDTIITNQAEQIMRKVVDAAESVYFLGEPSQTVLKVYVPNYIKQAVVSGKEIYYVVDTGSMKFDVSQVSSVNITGSLPITPGIHFIIIKAIGNGVDVSYE